MKKIIILFFALALFSCTEDENDVELMIDNPIEDSNGSVWSHASSTVRSEAHSETGLTNVEQQRQ